MSTKPELSPGTSRNCYHTDAWHSENFTSIMKIVWTTYIIQRAYKIGFLHRNAFQEVTMLQHARLRALQRAYLTSKHTVFNSCNRSWAEPQISLPCCCLTPLLLHSNYGGEVSFILPFSQFYTSAVDEIHLLPESWMVGQIIKWSCGGTVQKCVCMK